jgi:hypothetical protein
MDSAKKHSRTDSKRSLKRRPEGAKNEEHFTIPAERAAALSRIILQRELR